MSNPSGPIYEGVLAIHKPLGISSAQCIRVAQQAFNPSATFAPWLAAETVKRDAESRNQKQKRSRRQRRAPEVKMGHGGTLDPEATGVLILGIGSGTKSLQDFLGCSKSYECTVLFGAATDSYDGAGKVVGRKGFEHVTREKVEAALGAFRGKILQQPPIFSALRMDGKRLYEYAREGKELPRAIEKREVEVKELEVVEWMEGGSHEYRWPEEEADGQVRGMAEKVLHLGAEDGGQTENGAANDTAEGAAEPVAETSGSKRKREDAEDKTGGDAEAAIEPESKRTKSSPERAAGTTAPATAIPCPSPCVRLRMTVTSGFYVRSLAHDLGQAAGSLGLMSSLVRTRQRDFELGKNVLEYEELEKGEEVWGPRVKELLEEWQKGQREDKDEGREREKTPPRSDVGVKDRRDPTVRDGGSGVKGKSVADRRRRNTSSDED